MPGFLLEEEFGRTTEASCAMAFIEQLLCWHLGDFLRLHVSMLNWLTGIWYFKQEQNRLLKDSDYLPLLLVSSLRLKCRKIA